MSKRRPSEYQFTLANTEIENFFVARYWIGGNRYTLVILPFDSFYFLGIYKDGERQKIQGYGAGILTDTTGINFPDGDPTNWLVGDNQSYLVSSNYRTGFVLESTASTGILLNREAITAIDPEFRTPTRFPEALVFIQAVQYNTTYELFINNTLVSGYTTPKVDSGTAISTSQVLASLFENWQSAPGQKTYTYPDGTVYSKSSFIDQDAEGNPREEVYEQWEYVAPYKALQDPQRVSGYPPGDFVYELDPFPPNSIVFTLGPATETDLSVPGRVSPSNKVARVRGNFYISFVRINEQLEDLYKSFELTYNSYLAWDAEINCFVITDSDIIFGEQSYAKSNDQYLKYSIDWNGLTFYENGYLAFNETIFDPPNTPISTTPYQFGPAASTDPLPPEEDLDDGLDLGQFTLEIQQYVAWLYRRDGKDFTIRVDDSNANTLARAIKDEVVSLDQLPILAPNQFPILIANDPSVEIDDYWAVFQTSDGSSFSEGAWREGPAPGVLFRIDSRTMPQVLREVAEGEFFYGSADGTEVTHDFGNGARTFKFPKWGDRTAGDEDSAPDPAFIGQPISDLKIFRQRFFFSSFNRIMVSEADDIFNFFPDTVTNVLDTAPFDLLATGNTNSYIHWMTVTGREVMAFAEESQFIIEAAGDSAVFSPRTAGIYRLSTIETIGAVRPQLAGPTILLPTKEYGFTHVREYQYFPNANARVGLNLGNAQNVTENVPKYIPGTLSYWAVSDNLDYGVVLSPDDPRSLYVYQYRWSVTFNGTVKQQTAWSKWTFGQKVVNFLFEENALRIYFSDPTTGVEVGIIDAEELQNPAALDYLLDRRIDSNHSGVSASYDPETNWTTFTLPITAVNPLVAVTYRDNHSLWLGETSTGNQIVCDEPGDWTGETVVFGERYDFKCEMTRALLRSEGPGNAIFGDLSNRLQIHYWTVRHFNSAYYDVEVRRKNRQSTYATYRSRTLGVEGNRLNTETELLQDGELRVPVHARNTDSDLIVTSDSWLPVTLVGAEWEGMFSNRSRRLR